MEPFFILGLDLGQAHDPSALAVLEQSRTAPDTEASYAVRELRRWPLGTAYPQIVEEVTKLARTPPLIGCELVIDGTGCGRPVVDLFRASAITASVRPVLITAGHAVSIDENGYHHVAKVQLVSTLQVLLGTRRMKFARKLVLAATVERELANFKAKITAAGNETFAGDWREGQHDDLVLATAIAAWVGENIAVGPFTMTPDKSSRSVLDDAPEGVFINRPDGQSWPW
jgi:hypothetical protein